MSSAILPRLIKPTKTALGQVGSVVDVILLGLTILGGESSRTRNTADVEQPPRLVLPFGWLERAPKLTTSFLLEYGVRHCSSGYPGWSGVSRIPNWELDGEDAVVELLGDQRLVSPPLRFSQPLELHRLREGHEQAGHAILRRFWALGSQSGLGGMRGVSSLAEERETTMCLRRRSSIKHIHPGTISTSVIKGSPTDSPSLLHALSSSRVTGSWGESFPLVFSPGL